MSSLSRVGDAAFGAGSGSATDLWSANGYFPLVIEWMMNGELIPASANAARLHP